METTEIIAELRKLLKVGDSPVFCGGTFIPKLVAMEAADTLERQQQRLRDLSELVIRQGDEYAKLRRESEPVVHAHWIKHTVAGEDFFGSPVLKVWACNCSACGLNGVEEFPRCPHCGAHMDEEVADV